jgi:predicted metal-binding membrane protein
MIVAMMLPASRPLIGCSAGRAPTSPGPLRAKAALLGGYTVVWTGFGAVAFLGDLGVHHLVERWAWLAARPALVGGTVLLLAGGFQFSKLKDRCLRVCRHPAGYLLQHYRRGTGAAFRLGPATGSSAWAAAGP